MFTGIIESVAKVERVQAEGSNRHFMLSSTLSSELKVDQSVSHNGVCLTITRIEAAGYWVTAVAETLSKSTLGQWQQGTQVNVERCMLNNGRFDGHIVQGHVDQTGVVASVRDENGSWLFRFSFDPSLGNVVVEKGSIAVNGVSLTCFDVADDGFSVAIIPYTFQHTNFHQLKKGDTVNLEFDIIGKYVKRLLGKAG